MTEHLTTLQMQRYRSQALAPPELISAGDHLAVCPTCRDRVAGGDALSKAFQSFEPALHEAARVDSDHLDDNNDRQISR